MYDESHKIDVLCTNPKNTRGTRRKGIYEELLCEHCERSLAEYDDYGKKVLFGGTSIHVPKNYRDTFVFGEVDYDRFKLFQMSLLWRSAVSARPEFKMTRLGGPHLERSRQMILSKDPGEPHEYGCILIAETDRPDVMKLMVNFVHPPEMVKRRLDGHSVYRAAFGGVWWVWIVSSHSSTFPEQRLFLTRNGDLPLIKARSSSLGYLKRLAVDLGNAGMLD